MKIKAKWNFSPDRPYRRSCDELCNNVITLALPFVGYIEFFSEKKKYSDGLWYTSSSNGKCITVATENSVGDYILANIPASGEEIEEAFGNDTDHPKIWSDEEVLLNAKTFEIWDDTWGYIIIGKDDALDGLR